MLGQGVTAVMGNCMPALTLAAINKRSCDVIAAGGASCVAKAEPALVPLPPALSATRLTHVMLINRDLDTWQ
jgi:hypothetical protein